MKRMINAGGKQFELNALGQPLDEVFDRLYDKWFSDGTLTWDGLDSAAKEFFSKNPSDSSAHDAFFGNCTIIWSYFCNSAQYAAAEHVWERVLQSALQWEHEHNPLKLHKGTAYYFWGMTVLLRGDIDWGYLLMHQALEEDVRTSNQPLPNTPGLALLTLNDDQMNQAFRSWVLGQARLLDQDLISNYATMHQRSLSLAQVKQRFLQAPPDIETIFLLAYTLARLMWLEGRPSHTTKNRFAGQLQLSILFDTTLVIDAAIYAKNPATWRFAHHVERLLTVAGHRLTQKQLGRINRQFDNDFDMTVQAALNGALTPEPHTVLTRLQCDVALTYGLRNWRAHNVGSASIIWMRFPEVYRAVFRTLLATIDYLYP
jgi:hypothetical protein